MAKVFRKILMLNICLIFFSAFYPVNIERHFSVELFPRELINLGPEDASAETLCSIQDAVKILLPEAQNVKEEVKTLTQEQKNAIAKAADIQFDPGLDKEYCFSIGEVDGKIIGYAVVDNVKGKWGIIKYMLSFEPDGKVKDVLVLELKEKRGRPVKNRRFLDQFVGKTMNDQVKLKKDINGVAGATISSRGMTNGVRKLVYVFNELYKK